MRDSEKVPNLILNRSHLRILFQVRSDERWCEGAKRLASNHAAKGQFQEISLSAYREVVKNRHFNIVKV